MLSRNSPADCAREHSGPNVDSALMEDSDLEQVDSEGLELLQRTHNGARNKYEEEGSADTSCFRLTMIPVPYSPALNMEQNCRRVRNVRVKLSLGKGKGEEKVVV